MMSSELRDCLQELDLTQVDLARLIGVTPRAVSLWLKGDREIPGPVEAYVKLIVSLPLGIRQAEFSRLETKDSPMRDGMYGISFTSGTDVGMGVLVMEDGRIFGADAGSVAYDGEYSFNEKTGLTEIRLKVTFPPNVQSVFGVSNPYEWSIDVTAELDPNKDMDTIKVRTSIGRSLVATYKYLRAMPLAA